jgi:flagellar hook-basal body complex protein FliE
MVIPSVSSVRPVTQPTALEKSGASGGSSNAFTRGLENVQASLDNADKLAGQLANGTLTDVHTYTVAATKAELAVQMTVAIRDKAVEAYQEIMRMQV